MMMNDNSFNPYGLRDGEMSSGVSRQILLFIITNTNHNIILKQTTIMAVTYDGGVILGADSRTSTGSVSYISSKY